MWAGAESRRGANALERHLERRGCPDCYEGAIVDPRRGARAPGCNLELEQYLHLLGGEHGDGIGNAIEWLVAHADRSRLAIVEDVQDTSRNGIDVKFKLQVLGRIGNAEDVPLLRAWLLESSGSQQFAAAVALSIHPAPAAMDALLDATIVDDVEVVGTALYALGRRGDEAARPTIESFLSHPDKSHRISAINALGDLGVGPSRALLEVRRKVEQDKDAQARLALVLGP